MEEKKAGGVGNFAKETRKDGVSGTEVEYEHESFGMVGVFRRSGNGGKLFGSAIEQHHSTIAIRVYRAKRIHSETLSYDRFFPDGRLPLLELEMSAAQFAEMITTPNSGDGIPVTIRTVEGRRMAPVPEDTVLESEMIRKNFAVRMREMMAGVRASHARMKEVLSSKKALTQQDRKAALDILDQAVTDIASNIPFVLEQFEEATDKVVSTAKAEVESMMTRAVHMIGLKALTRPEELEVPRLPSYDPESEEKEG
jgi:hypothetical protein